MDSSLLAASYLLVVLHVISFPVLVGIVKLRNISFNFIVRIVKLRK